MKASLLMKYKTLIKYIIRIFSIKKLFRVVSGQSEKYALNEKNLLEF